MYQPGLFRLALIAVALLLAAVRAWPEDVVQTKTQTFRGRVTSVDATGVHIQLSQGGEVTVPRAGIVQLTVEPPPSVVRGLAAYEKGDLREALLNLGKITTHYRGLDTGWVVTGLVYFARASLRAGQYDQAAQAFASFQQTYPEHPLGLAAAVGLAAIELSRKNYTNALERFQELAEPYTQQIKPPKDQLPYVAEIYLGLGQTQEGLGHPAEALNEYWRVIGLYPVEPSCSEALYRAAELLVKSNQPQKAEKMLTELIENYPASSFAERAVALRKTLGSRRTN
ncbi:MAG: tetratricopeptide repeat protein [Lentisphaerae bacterium]|nr:tetratricopeptide repeat protein [Lentisphaerota bacterium]